MTKRDQLIECMSAMEDGMIQLSRSRDIWQNELIWWICKAVGLLLEKEVKRVGEKDCSCISEKNVNDTGR